MDDEEMVGEIACQMLEYLGIEGIHVFDGNAAIAEYSKCKNESDPFAAVVMDLTIPGGMGGKEAITEILAIDKEARVFVSSGYSTDPVMVNYKDYGFVGVISKPFDLAAIQKVVEALA